MLELFGMELVHANITCTYQPMHVHQIQDSPPGLLGSELGPQSSVPGRLDIYSIYPSTSKMTVQSDFP